MSEKPVPREQHAAIAEAVNTPLPAPAPTAPTPPAVEPDRVPEAEPRQVPPQHLPQHPHDAINPAATYIVAYAFWGLMILLVAVEAIRRSL